METSVLHSILPAKSTSLILTRPSSTNIPILRRCRLRHQSLRTGVTNSSTGSDTSSSSNAPQLPPPTRPPPITPPDTVGIRFRRGSKRRSRQVEDGVSDGGVPKKAPTQPKDWEAMSITEKAIEMYMGEKGALFWLNKFAYASIFIMIGAWILFRFVGPALNIYQLDSDILPPSAILKGS